MQTNVAVKEDGVKPDFRAHPSIWRPWFLA
jgi:hypothetical protein